MACNSTNGQTYVNTCIPAAGGTATSSTYVLNLTHYTCGNRKICANGAFPITSNLNYTVIGSPQNVGNSVFNVDVLVSGTVTYMPYRNGQNNCGCECNPCPITENVWTTISVPFGSATTPAVIAGTVIASPTNLRDCCNVTNAISLTTSFNVTTEKSTSDDNEDGN